MYGFIPGEVVPTSQLLLAHKHPDDRERAAAIIATAAVEGGRWSLRHRIIDTHNRVHTLVTLGEAIHDPRGQVIALAGYVVDLTRSQQIIVTNEMRAALTGISEHGAVIEQAKGALQAIYNCAPDQAFALLRNRSQRTNTKLHIVAAQLLAAMRDRPVCPIQTRTTLDELLDRPRSLT